MQVKVEAEAKKNSKIKVKAKVEKKALYHNLCLTILCFPSTLTSPLT